MGGFEQFALIPEQGATPQIGQLDAQMQENIRRLAARLNVRDAAAVMGFGAKVQKELNTFSSIALEQMLSKDIEPLDGMMKALGEQIRACSFGKEANPSLPSRRSRSAPAPSGRKRRVCCAACSARQTAWKMCARSMSGRYRASTPAQTI